MARRHGHGGVDPAGGVLHRGSDPGAGGLSRPVPGRQADQRRRAPVPPVPGVRLRRGRGRRRAGRNRPDLQRAHGMAPQVVLTVPLLEGTDGVRKMSKSFDNYVGIAESAAEQFGKLMRIPDDLIVKYLRLCSPLVPTEVDAVEAGLADGSLGPNDQKRRMAREVVDLYHGQGAGIAAEERFDAVHREHRVPDDVPTVSIPQESVRGGRVWLPRLLSAMGLAASNAEARRAIQQGGVRIDGTPATDPEAEFDPRELQGRVLQVGRRRFVRIGPDT